MNFLIEELFEKVKSKNKTISSGAVTDLSFILEINSWNLSEDERGDRYGGLVSQEVIKLKINEQDEKRIIDFLSNEIINDNPLNGSLLFAVGQASCKIALQPLITIIEQHLDNFNENEVYQALIALERLLFFNDTLSAKSQKELLKSTNVIIYISRKILLLQPSLHSDLESTSLRVLARLVLLLNDKNI